MVLSGAALQVQNLANALEALAASYAVSNPAVAGRLTNARDEAWEAISELLEIPSDTDQAVQELQSVVDRIQDAMNESPGLPAAQAHPLMDEAAGIARQLANDELNAAILRLGNPVAILDAQTDISNGDTQRLGSNYRQATSYYRSALQSAQGA